MRNEWPKCEKCKQKLCLSKLERDKWVCKNCNLVFCSKDVLFEDEILDYDKKCIKIVNK